MLGRRCHLHPISQPHFPPGATSQAGNWCHLIHLFKGVQKKFTETTPKNWVFVKTRISLWGRQKCNIAGKWRKEFPNKQSKIKRGEGLRGPRGEKRGRISGRRDVGGERGGADSHHGTRPQCVCLALPQQASHPKDTASRKLFSGTDTLKRTITYSTW